MTKFQIEDTKKNSLLKEIKEIHSNLALLYQMIGNDSLSEDLAKQVPLLLENKLLLIMKDLNYDSFLHEEQENRYKKVRLLNEKIRELELMIAENKDIHGIKETLKYLRDKVRDWWSYNGFNHISNIQFSEYGSMKGEFCFMLEHNRSFRGTEKTKESHYQYLVEKGFEFSINEKDSSYKKKLLDNKNNRLLLKEMLIERFPSIVIHSFSNFLSFDSDEYLINHIEFEIYELTDI